MAEVIALPKKCPGCKRIMTPPNKLVRVGGIIDRCLICVEEQAHKDLMKWLSGEGDTIFFCSNIGDEDAECTVVHSFGRNYMQIYTTEELLEEVEYRRNETSEGSAER